MPKSRSTRRPVHVPEPAVASALVDREFIPMRAKLIEVAAFFDRVERYRKADDFRCVALREAATVLVDGKSERARRVLEKLSDPTTDPEPVSSGKAAVGAWQPVSPPAPTRRTRR